MTAEEFIKKFIDLTDTKAEINLSTKLSDVEEWDSLSMVSFYSFCDSKLNRKLLPEQIKSAQTVEDLFKLSGGQSS